MGARRYLEYNPGAWKVDTESDLTYIRATFGDEVYIVDQGIWQKYNGSAWEDLGSSSGAASIVHQLSITLTNAQIKALPTTPIQLAGAPGSNRAIFPTFGVGVLDTLAGGYTNLGDQTGAKWWLINDSGSSPLTMLADISTFLQLSARNYFWFLTESLVGDQTPFNLGSVISSGSGWSEVVNLPLLVADQWTDQGNYLSGNAANTCKLAIQFAVLDLATGAFLSTDDSGWNQTLRTFS